MPRYIDADKLVQVIEENMTRCAEKSGDPTNYVVKTYLLAKDHAIDFINVMPPADVVPRADVDELIGKLECFLCHATGGRLSKHTYDIGTMESVATDCINETYNDGYGEGYKDCAKEIFEEIYEDCFDQFGYIDYEKLAELKKKYTDAETEPPKGD